MNSQRVFLTGGTGFTGSHVAQRLVEAGFRVRALVRPRSDQKYLHPAVERVTGILEDVDALGQAMRECDVLVNAASIGFGHAPGILAATRLAEVRRAVFFSSTSLFTILSAKSKALRQEAEEAVVKSGLNWTILRPTMIYGSERDRNLCRLVRFIRKSPLIPVFGDGESLQQPVYVDDLAIAVVSALKSAASVGRAYNLPGAAPISYNRIIETIAALLGKHARSVYLPPGPFISLMRTWEATGLRAPLKAEQIQRLNEDKTFDYVAAQKDFAYSPRAFEEGIKQEIEKMGLLKAFSPQS